MSSGDRISIRARCGGAAFWGQLVLEFIPVTPAFFKRRGTSGNHVAQIAISGVVSRRGTEIAILCAADRFSASWVLKLRHRRATRRAETPKPG